MSNHRRLVVDPAACEGRGLCFELVPELISSDDWGFPIVSGREVNRELLVHARRAVAACPVLALHLVPVPEPVRSARVRQRRSDS